jgi:ABC-type transport system substrate-binding protein
MGVRGVSQQELFEAENTGNFEAVLTEGVSGRTLLRPYQFWHSKTGINPGSHFGDAAVESALERVRQAEDEATYRAAVSGFQQAFTEDPPAILLAWIERARAVSKRFVVPAAEPGRDILGTLRLWTPRNEERLATRN